MNQAVLLSTHFINDFVLNSYHKLRRDLAAQPAAEDSGFKIQVSGSKIYDLSGRRLSAPPVKGMYIEEKRVKIRE